MTKGLKIDWLPKNQCDIERANALLDRPITDIEPIIPQLIQWLKDDSWLVAQPVAECLRKVGSIAVPEISYVLHGKNKILIKHVIRDVVSSWSTQDVAKIHGILGMLMSNGQSWGADLEAFKILVVHKLIEINVASQWVAFKRARHTEYLNSLNEIVELMG